MATTRWIGNAVPNMEEYFWKEDVTHQMKFFRRTPQEQFAESLKSLMKGDGPREITVRGDELWIHANGLWMRINCDGTIEIGEPGA
jgi:hypothetical protein